MIYNKPILGKCGVRSKISKKMAFGICCDCARECKSELIKKIGFWESQKYRWQYDNWNKNDIKMNEINKDKQ